MPLLVLQTGHVGRTTGATGTAGEQAMTASVGAKVKATCPAGWTCRVIAADVSEASYKGDVFVAVHGDGSTNRAVRGASVGYQNDSGRVLAATWKAAYTAQGWPGGWHKDNYTSALSGYYGMNHAARQGVTRRFILEVGMMTNPADRAWIDRNHAAIAASIWEAVAGEVAEVADHIYVVVADLGDGAHRLALKALAASQSDHYEEGVTTFAAHCKPGSEADAYINYAKAHALDCQSVYTTGPAHSSMLVRNKGAKPECDGQVAGKLTRINTLADEIKRVVAQ